jgi:hypothetical protein
MSSRNTSWPERRAPQPRRSLRFGGVVLWGLLTLGTGWAQSPKNCAFDAKQRQLARRTQAVQVRRQALEEALRAYRQLPAAGGRTQARLIRIPVVVHVIHNNAAGTIGGPANGNISDEQIRSQLQVLNEDYRRAAGTNGFNTDPVGADLEIEFFLATRDPDGNPSTGITRTYNSRASFSIFTDDLLLASLAYWPSNRYLNIWVTSLQGGVLGYAQFPSVAGVEGLDTGSEPFETTDGVFIDHPAFGRRTGTATSGVYRDGRTATHEIGHWLGLIHTWGDEFCGNDYCPDTPKAEGPNQTTQCQELFSNCDGIRTRNQTENYLDLSPDLCMNLFTQDQKSRIRAVLDLAPRRRDLINTSNPVPDAEALTVRVYPNPAQGRDLEAEVRFTGIQDIQLELYTLQGTRVAQRTYPAQPSGVFRLSAATLPTGAYLLRLTAGTQVLTRRVQWIR